MLVFSKNVVKSLLSENQRQIAQKFKLLSQLVFQDIRTNLFGQIFPLRPTVLNLLVNDVCNSRCQMCSIWKQKLDKELTPKELGFILADTLFDKLLYVGISGGEPTLRRDLPDIYRVLVNKRPPIYGTGIITNAINKKHVIPRILASAKICHEGGIPFNIMVSLDGVGEVHDLVRGCNGNFNSAVAIIRYFRDKTEIPISVGCTVTKDNVWHVDEVLEFCRSERVYVRFRVAEFIRRLNNADQVHYIRNFSDLEAYHLGLFFAKLEHCYETSPEIKNTYGNIRRMLMENATRSIACDFQNSAVTLDCKGQLLFCAPQSPVLGNCLEESAQTLYKKNIDKREVILKTSCSNCLHDYHSKKRVIDWWSEKKDRYWKQRLSLDQSLTNAKKKRNSRHTIQFNQPPKEFLIIGWYGTETAGDKAILGQIVHDIVNKHPSSEVVLASLYPYLSRWTVRELGYSDIKVIPTYSSQFWKFTKKADEIIMGGGPLMHLEELGIVLLAFINAKTARHRTRIAGCGIGPIDRNQKYREALKHILNLADIIELRDSASVRLARQMTGRNDITNTGDPAIKFVQRWMNGSAATEETNFLNLYLREWTREYQKKVTPKQFDITKAAFEKGLEEWVHRLCVNFNLKPRLLPMHHFYMGNDDRDFNRRFAQRYLSDLNPIVVPFPLSVTEILESMQSGRLSICMRFHSVIFANTLAVPFLAIDYTQGGKIAGYLTDHNRLNQMISLLEISNGKWKHYMELAKKLIEL